MRNSDLTVAPIRILFIHLNLSDCYRLIGVLTAVEKKAVFIFQKVEIRERREQHLLLEDRI
jgi:hypothetical protein